MRYLVVIISATILFASPAEARCNKRGHYIAASGHVVKNPRCVGRGHIGAHFLCRDGSYSHSERRRGACSRHRGVKRALW